MMRRVRLELARCHEFPEGSTAHGYALHVPLTAAGKLDRESWPAHRAESVFAVGEYLSIKERDDTDTVRTFRIASIH
jgi:hypothetical protein